MLADANVVDVRQIREDIFKQVKPVLGRLGNEERIRYALKNDQNIRAGIIGLLNEQPQYLDAFVVRGSSQNEVRFSKHKFQNIYKESLNQANEAKKMENAKRSTTTHLNNYGNELKAIKGKCAEFKERFQVLQKKAEACKGQGRDEQLAGIVAQYQQKIEKLDQAITGF